MTLSVMIPLMKPCVLFGVTVMLLNAGGYGETTQNPNISVSKTAMTLVDRINLTCLTPPNSQSCSFYIHRLNKPDVKISQNQECTLKVNVTDLFSPEAPPLNVLREQMEVYCTVINTNGNSSSNKVNITVWNLALPITYTVFVLAIFGSVTVISLACLCITCAIIASTNVNRKAVYTRSGEARDGYKEDHKLNSAPEEAENEKEKKGAEDELCYATVIHPDNFARSIKFQQSTEYATVVINMSDTGVDTEDNIDDTGKDEEDLV